MIGIIGTGFAYIAAAVLFRDRLKAGKAAAGGLLLAAFALRVLLGTTIQGFPSDYACFYSWARMAFEGGLSNFYSSGVFADYPPGYIYVLWLVGALLKGFGAGYGSMTSFLIVKLPAMLCDMASGMLLYRMAEKKWGESRAAYAAALYLFNPAVILNSSVWGQVDAVIGLALLCMCRLLTEKKTVPAYYVFAAGILLKPQMLIFTPVLIYGIIENVLIEDFCWKNFRYNLFCGLGAIAAMALLCLPFGGVGKIIALYTDTMSSYPYATVNAYNFWAMIGKNWAAQDGTLLFMKYSTWGTLGILTAVALSALFFFRARGKESRYYTTAALLIVWVFLFAVRMHERYVFPALVLLMAAYAVRPLKSFLAVYLALTAQHLYNTADVLFEYMSENYHMDWTALRYAGAAAVLTGAAFLAALWISDRKKIEPPEKTGCRDHG